MGRHRAPLRGFSGILRRLSLMPGARTHRRILTRRCTRRGRKSGSVALEFAILFIPFFFLLMGTVEMMVYFVVSGSLDDATVIAARDIRTDQPGMRTDPDAVRQRICDNLVPFVDCRSIYIAGQRYGDFKSIRPINPINNRVFNPASVRYEPNFSNDIYLLTAYYDLHFFTPFIGQFFSNIDGNRRLMVSSFAFRNEP